MPARKQIQPGEKVSLKLTATERTLVLEDLMLLDENYQEMVQGTPPGKPVMMTLDELDDFAGYIAAEANHCDDTKKQKKMDSVFQKAQDLLGKYTDEEPPQTLKIEDARKSKAEPPARGQSPRKPKTPSDLLYQFKIRLLDIKPAIWRRIQVQDCTLTGLHEYIQAALGWENYHLHQFEIDGVTYSQPAPDGDDFGMEFEDEAGVLLSKLIPKSGRKSRWIYEYDFGDGWRHEVLFEGFPPNDPKAKYPLCLEGERACPPEDCGGLPGYENYVAAIADSRHEQHEEMLRWRGPFDSEAFDAKKATKEMKRVKR